MGLVISIFRDSYDSSANVFYSKRDITLTNVEGPFQPNENAPAAKLTTNALGNFIIVPDDDYSEKEGPQMFGGTYGATSDSRFSSATKTYGAIPIHDRRETWKEYDRLTR